MVTPSRSGVTLIEMVVTLVILGIMLTVAAQAGGRRSPSQRNATAAESIDSLKRLAAATHKARQLTLRVSGVTYAYLALPDGRIFRSTRIAGEGR